MFYTCGWGIKQNAQIHQAGIKSRFIWWLGQSLVLVVGLLATIQFLPQIGFIFLLLPVFPLFMAMFAIASASIKDIWAYAIGFSIFQLGDRGCFSLGGITSA